MIGRRVTLERSLSGPEVNIIMDSVVAGQLDAAVGNPVALALERGQSFTAVIEKAFPMYNDKFKLVGAYIDLKVEYLLENGQPAIETVKCWRCVDSPDASHEPYAPGSFFTTVAGVSHEGRQRIVARCSEGENLILVRDPGNRFDAGAIKVMRLNGEQLGFVPTHVSRGGDSSGLAFQMDQGSEYRCRIKNMTGGVPGKSTRGLNIEITEMVRVADAEGEDYQALVRRRISELTTKSDAVSAGGATKAQPALLWIFAIIVIGCVLWAALK